MADDRDFPLVARLLMVLVLGAILAAFLLAGAVLWANSGDGPCDGPTVTTECHRE